MRFPALLTLTLISALSSAAHAELTPERLRCEYRNDPLAIEAPRPRLFWTVRSNERGQKQTAYQIHAASKPELLRRDSGDLWDSGKVTSSETIHIPYAGKPLGSGQAVYWKVRVWDAAGKPSGWSKPASWRMGLLKPEDWKAKWIAFPPAPNAQPNVTLDGTNWVWHAPDGATPPAGKRYLRGKFNLPADTGINSAHLAITADDSYTVWVNGKRVDSGQSWQAFKVTDIRDAIKIGPNVIAVEAENGSQGPAGVIAKVDIKTSAGSFGTVTDSNWKASNAPADKWQEAGFDDASWETVRIVGNYGVQPWGAVRSTGSAVMPPAPYFRKTFTAAKPIRSAMVYATAMGVYELSLNGQRIDSDVLSPGWTDYRKRVYYFAYDVTKQVKNGPNALGAILGDGWYAGFLGFTGRRQYYGSTPMLRVQMEIEYADGERVTVGSDGSWKSSLGPILHGDLLMGSAIDTRKELNGWDTPTFNDASWTAAQEQEAPKALLQAHPGDPIRPTATLPAKSRVMPKEGVYVYDIGQNLSGWVRLRVNGKPGQVITVRHGERLDKDGALYTTNLRAAKAIDTYTLKGGPQVLEPKFTFHGFQYVEITGLDKPLETKDVVGIAVHSDVASTMKFTSDNPLLDKFVQNIDWGQRGNFLDVPTDCPQRDERLGWTGDAQVFAKTAMFNRDSGAFFTKWLVDLCQDSQLPNGAYGDVAPALLGGGNAAWEDAGVICTYRTFEMYGDTQIIQDHWASMTRFMEHLAAVSPEGVRQAGAYGDWLLLDGPQHSPIHGTAYYVFCARLMSEMAAAIGKDAESQHYKAITDKIRQVFIERFVTADGKVEDKGKTSQTFYALALGWNLLPEEKRAAAAQHLADLIKAKNGLATGFIGTPVLLPALQSAGKSSLAADLLLTEKYPSWLYQVKLGATTTWERWDGWMPEKGFQDAGMNSFNHYWLGCVGEWIYTGLAGIDTSGPGFSKITIRPQVDNPLKHVRLEYDSIRGKVISEWRKQDKSLTLTVTVPANTTATVYIPSPSETEITQGGVAAKDAPGVQYLKREGNTKVFAIGSGSYTFTVAL